MRKYLAVAKTLFKAQFAYRFDVIMTAVSTVWRIIFALILWGAIFANRESVGGFTYPEMLSYYVISSFYAMMDMSAGVLGEISGRIKDGSFSKFMIIPSNPQLHFLSQTLGASAYYGLFIIIALVASTLVFRIDLILTFDLPRMILAVLVFLSGIAFMNSYQFLLGIFALKYQDTTFSMHLLPSIISFLSGELVPLSLLPGIFTAAIKVFPFAHVVYTPTMLMIGRMDIREGLSGCALLLAWTIGMTVVNQLTYTRLRKRYEGVGI